MNVGKMLKQAKKRNLQVELQTQAGPIVGSVEWIGRGVAGISHPEDDSARPERVRFSEVELVQVVFDQPERVALLLAEPHVTRADS